MPLTPDGLQIKTIEEMLDEMSESQRADIAQTLDTSVDQPLGKLNGIVAAQLREVYELLFEAYHGFDRDSAEKKLLDYIGALIGVPRDGPEPSLVLATVDLDAGQTLDPAVHFASVAGEPDNRWTPQESFTSPANGTHEVLFRSEEDGKFLANTGTLTVIATPIIGWNSVTNAADATPGSGVEEDPDYRQRQEEELRATGAGTLPAMTSDLLQGEGVEQATFLENNTEMFDPVNSIPPKTIKPIIYDGIPSQLTNDEIAQLIFETKGGGVGTVGNESGLAVGPEGGSHRIYFTRPQQLLVYVQAALLVSSDGWVGEAAAEEALVTLNVTDLFPARDVIASRVIEVLMLQDGVIDVPAATLFIDLIGPPVAQGNLAVSVTQIARLDTARITLIPTEGSPP